MCEGMIHSEVEPMKEFLSVRMILIISGGGWIVYHYNGEAVDIFPG